jgi:hypothetical protein
VPTQECAYLRLALGTLGFVMKLSNCCQFPEEQCSGVGLGLGASLLLVGDSTIYLFEL